MRRPRSMQSKLTEARMEVETVHAHDECIICKDLISSARQIGWPGTAVCDCCHKSLIDEVKMRGLTLYISKTG